MVEFLLKKYSTDREFFTLRGTLIYISDIMQIVIAYKIAYNGYFQFQEFFCMISIMQPVTVELQIFGINWMGENFFV